LVLEVDEALGRAKGALVCLEDAEVAPRERPIDLLRHGAHDLHLDAAGRGLRHDGRQHLAGHLVP